MARILGNPFGEIRGKIAGNVFSRNASGQIIRSYVIPANRNTQAQQDSRNQFRNASQFWKTLSQAAQQNWNDFSVSEYNPLRGVNNGQFTGNMAQVAIRSAVLNAINQAFSGTYTKIGGINDPTGTDDAFAASQTPPLKSVQANLKQSSGAPATFTYAAFSITVAGVVAFDVVFNAPLGTNDADNFIDENSNAYSWKCYMSDPVSQIGGRPKNDFFNSIGSALPITFAVDTLASLDGVKISWDFSSLIPKMLSFPQIGQIVKMTLSCISIDGTMIKNESRYVTLT